jgi:hypothetical protein
MVFATLTRIMFVSFIWSSNTEMAVDQHGSGSRHALTVIVTGDDHDAAVNLHVCGPPYPVHPKRNRKPIKSPMRH